MTFGPQVHKDPECMDFPKPTKHLFLWDQFSRWLVHLNMSWPRGSAQYFNRYSIDIQPAILKTRLPLLKQFKILLQTRIKLFCVRLIFPVFSPTFRWEKLSKFVRTPYMTAIWLLQSWIKTSLLNLWTLQPLLLNLVLITKCISKLMVLLWAVHLVQP